MKILYFIIIALLCSVNIFGQWTQLNSPTSQSLNSVFFSDTNTGFVGGNIDGKYATLLKTTDGGASWVPLNITTENSIRSIWFKTSQTGFITTDNVQQTFRTIDGGVNWSIIDIAIYNAGDIYFKNANVGFAYSSNNGDDVSYSFNGGASWTRYPNGTFNGVGISAIHFSHPGSSVGYAVSSWEGRVFKTTNNGMSWTQISQPTTENINDVFFTSTTDGFILGDGFILKTIDGGSNWTVVDSSAGGRKIAVFDNSVFISNYDSISLSANGGLDFVKMSGTLSGLYDLHLLSGNEGFCVGNSGRIFKLGNVTGLNDIRHSTPLKIFPNPVLNCLYLNDDSNFQNYQILNQSGQIVQSGNLPNNAISLKDIPGGVYTIVVTDTNNKIRRAKFIKI